MIKCVSVLLLVVFLGVCTELSAANITYNVYFASGTNTITGSIVTDGTIGSIFSSNIVGWSFKATGAPEFFSSRPGGVSQLDCLGVLGCLHATLTTLSFDFHSIFSSDQFFGAFSETSRDSRFLIFSSDTPNQPSGAIVRWTYIADFNDPGSVVNASVIPSSNIVANVPEPVTSISLVFGLCVVFVINAQTFRK